jgi:hypothetical protein
VVVTTSPVLGLSVKNNLESKLQFLEDRLALNPVELKRIVVARPPVLGLSVEKSLEPKLDYLEARLGLR